MEPQRIEGCTGVLLCGGKSRRMGFDKAFLQVQGEYLLLRHAKTMRALFGQVLAVCERAGKFADVPALDSLPQAADHYPETGPLGGICTAFEETEGPWLFVMACDMPSFDYNLAYKMYDKLQNADVVLCQTEGYLEPLFAFYNRRCLPVFRRQIEEGRLSLRAGFPFLKVEVLKEEAGCFTNLNTPEELARWTERGAQEGEDGV